MAEQEQNIFDQIRADADEKRKARLEEKTKAAEFFAQMKTSADTSLKLIRKKLLGENK